MERRSALPWLALGTFAIGTEGFMIAAILPRIAADLSQTVAVTGTLVSVFSLAYALSSPLLTTLAGKVDRKTLLLGSMIAFTVANLVAAATHTYGALAAARVLLASAAGLYVPNANALASALVPPERRGRAIAIVNAGLTVAIAIGVPLGAFVGNRFGWRMTFVAVAAISLLATGGLFVGLPAGIGAGMAVAPLRERLRVIRLPRVAPTLLLTTVWATGTYSVYTFIAPLLTATTTLRSSQIGYALFLWGASAGVGLLLGGSGADRLGNRIVIRTSLGVLAVALASLSLVAVTVRPSLALVPTLAAIVVWGLSAWAFYPAMQARLIELAGVRLAPVVLSLNASFMYIGFSLGAALGGFTVSRWPASHLGATGAVCELVALALFALLSSRAPARTADAPALTMPS